MKYKAIIFDLDGTLYDKRGLKFLMLLNDLRHWRLLKSERDSRREIAGRHFGPPEQVFSALFSRMASKTGASQEDVENWFFNTFMPMQARLLKIFFKARPGIREKLVNLRRQGVKLAVFSDYCLIRQKLESIGLSADMFDVVVESPDAGGLKPCKESFLYVADKLETAPEDILMVGDRTATDGAGAESAGMHFKLIQNNSICFD